MSVPRNKESPINKVSNISGTIAALCVAGSFTPLAPIAAPVGFYAGMVGVGSAVANVAIRETSHAIGEHSLSSANHMSHGVTIASSLIPFLPKTTLTQFAKHTVQGVAMGIKALPVLTGTQSANHVGIGLSAASSVAPLLPGESAQLANRTIKGVKAIRTIGSAMTNAVHSMGSATSSAAQSVRNWWGGPKNPE